ncbi:MAG TPA: helix-turn-helix domain-containing protein [Lachnospiraceae bacterium]|nr:helix-turn-helix domain-containing protein [Lachnospiraceae bacterium]
MEWYTAIRSAIDYMEKNLNTVTGTEEVADSVHMSAMYLQRGFQIVTGYGIGEYLRNRRLYQAALRLSDSDYKVIDAALDSGYETPESFSKSFTRFHGFAPSEAKNRRQDIRPFLPLKVNISISGGEKMDYIVEKMAAFKVMGFEREFSMDSSYGEIPKFWNEITEKYERNLCAGKAPSNAIEQAIYDNRIGEYGICIDDIGHDGRFHYMIAGRYMGGKVPEGMKLLDIPEADWAKFKCQGALPDALQSVNTAIWKEWLPGNKEYEIDGDINIEWYSNGGLPSDSDYQSAIWISVKKKAE